jgi:lipopolysaccharide transport system ATP-binding protein
MRQSAIRVSGIGKQYRIGRRERYRTLRDSLAELARRPFRRLRGGEDLGGGASRIWALRDVTFEVEPGEVIGIIGRNGAGKSTLLKILSRITEPTTGEADLCGRVGSLLEVGTGFNPELTGRENIYLNGAILGMRRTEIARKFDEIVAFAEIEQFLDTPAKHYSSGMYMRLAFAVAANLEPEILLIDEVLAVGDIQFQKRCLGKMGEVAASGRTVLFVSHNMQAVARLCRRGICLHAGSVAYDGAVSEAIRAYYDLVDSSNQSAETVERRIGSGEVRFTRVVPEQDSFRPDEEKRVRFVLEKRAPNLPPLYLSAHVVDASGLVVAQCDSRLVGVEVVGSGDVEGCFILKTPWLKPGDYHVDLIACAAGMGILDLFERSCKLTVLPLMPYGHGASTEATQTACVLSDFDWSVQARGEYS